MESYSLKFNTESEHKERYPSSTGDWSIDEVDENGIVVGAEKQIPCKHFFWFDAKEITGHYSHSIDFGCALSGEEMKNPENHEFEFLDHKFILLRLEPSECRLGRDTSFSVFGTNEKVKEFQLSIMGQNQKGKHRKQVAISNFSGTDPIRMHVHVKEKTLKQLVDLVTQKSLSSFSVGIGHVDGFYYADEYSMDGSIDDVKILMPDHELSIPKNCKIEPPRTGYIGEISLTPISTQKLEPYDPEFNESEDNEGEDNKPERKETDRLLLAIGAILILILLVIAEK